MVHDRAQQKDTLGPVRDLSADLDSVSWSLALLLTGKAPGRHSRLWVRAPFRPIHRRGVEGIVPSRSARPARRNPRRATGPRNACPGPWTWHGNYAPAAARLLRPRADSRNASRRSRDRSRRSELAFQQACCSAIAPPGKAACSASGSGSIPSCLASGRSSTGRRWSASLRGDPRSMAPDEHGRKETAAGRTRSKECTP